MKKPMLALPALGLLLCLLFSLTTCDKKKKDGGKTAVSQTETSVLTEKSSESRFPGGYSLAAPPISSFSLPPAAAAVSDVKISWGSGRGKQHQPPNGVLSFQEKYAAYNAHFIEDTTKKTVFLTFDEGYENGYSDRILDVLKEKQVKAVFFVTMDFAKTNPKLITRMIQEGHTVGNHSTTHPSFPAISAQKQREELQTLHDYIQKEFGYKMRLLRYPMGEFSEESLAVAKAMGYEAVFWSFAYKDWIPTAQPAPEESLRLLSDQLHNGAIYLLHAVSKTNTAILGDFIDAARQAGYAFGSYT